MNRDDWKAAFAAYERQEAAYEEALREYEAELRVFESELPDRDQEFEPYGLRFKSDASRDRLIRDTEVAVTVRDYAGRCELSADDFAAITRKAATLVDAYLGYTQKRGEAIERIVRPAERKHDAAVDKREEAREALLNTPAPDGAAVLAKLNLLADMMEGEQNSEHVEAIRDDASRLLGEAQ